eukprot:TRINITY_DN8729_c0_g1_i1.p1 TRINITY_DN8729_c0_g1~~TRINITY_DN8729_c0_g1_i1.p1  ORF type:complete len:505 (+),score=70.17 TRINITY_DN8729_c0_g1_i1:27-1517(+)
MLRHLIARHSLGSHVRLCASQAGVDRKAVVLSSLKTIIDPDFRKDIVSLGFIKQLEVTELPHGKCHVGFQVELTTPACPLKAEFKRQCEEAVRALPWVQTVDVAMTAQQRKLHASATGTTAQQLKGLESVANIIAVSSCKGGVGKSTIAVNLAFALAAAGGKVGICDIDIYGPSLPTLVKPDTPVSGDGASRLLLPAARDGVQLMSYGYLPQKTKHGAAMIRGPIASTVVQQLLLGTKWGNLDYLILDMPPGTGDIHLTVGQSVPITAAVIVTTPQRLSFIDVVKGIELFDRIKVPPIAVVENMSYFQPHPDGERYHLFGRGARRRLVEEYGFRLAFQMPIQQELAEASDSGTPLVLTDPNGAVATTMRDIAAAVVREVSVLRHAAVSKPSVRFDGKAFVVSFRDAKDQGLQQDEYRFDPVTVRMECRGAHTVDEWTGKLLIRREDLPADLSAESVTAVGNYAVQVVWNHAVGGHPVSIFPDDLWYRLARKADHST